MSADSPRRLGRGLEALISTAKQQRESKADAPPSAESAGSGSVRIAEVRPNRFQPRRVFTEADLGELQASMGASGLLQPITVRPSPEGGWELVAGERRLRAATRLGWTDIPAYVREFDDRAMLTLALVENLQRTDLNAIEEADGYQRLIQEFGLTQQQVADAVGKDRTTITNLIRVLSLPEPVRRMVEQGHLTPGHARALLVVKEERRQLELANEIVAHHLSVRDVESRARQLSVPGSTDRSKRPASSKRGQSASANAAVRQVEEQLRRRLQTDVSVQQTGKDRGMLRVAFYGADDLERLLDLILGKRQGDFD